MKIRKPLVKKIIKKKVNKSKIPTGVVLPSSIKELLLLEEEIKEKLKLNKESVEKENEKRKIEKIEKLKQKYFNHCENIWAILCKHQNYILEVKFNVITQLSKSIDFYIETDYDCIEKIQNNIYKNLKLELKQYIDKNIEPKDKKDFYEYFNHYQIKHHQNNK